MLWRAGVVDLGLDPDYFWLLTLHEFDVLIDRLDAKRRREIDIPSAALRCTIVNIHRDREARPEPYKLTDFLPGEEDEAELVDPATAELTKLTWVAIMSDGQINLRPNEAKLPVWATTRSA